MEAPTNSTNPVKDDNDIRTLVPYIDFSCYICGMKEKSLFGELKASDGYYPSPVYFMRDPFVPPPRVKARRPVLADFLVLGTTCSMCEQTVCMSKSCSIYFGSHFCANCIVRERRKFPAEVLEKLSKAQETLANSQK